jgi:tyrosine-protein kinase Etk/Wzc
MNQSVQSAFVKGKEMSLLDLLVVPLKWKRMIGFLVLGAIVISFGVSILMPTMYTATARILPPQDTAGGVPSFISQGGAGLAGLAGNLLGGKSSADVYVGILESRTVADSIISSFKLKDLYQQNTMTGTYRMLADRTRVEISSKTQIIGVSVTDPDPERAAAMANAYVEALDQTNRRVNITEGQRKRIFLETRLDRVDRDLKKAEGELKEFQQKYGLVAVEEQARASIEGASRIKAEIIAAETELQVLKQFGTERQSEAIMLKTKISELNKHLGKIENGGGSKESGQQNFFISFQDIPELSMELVRLVRETKTQEKVFELLTSQYELAKIEEAKDVNTVQVLDRAVPADRKSGPRRLLIASLSALAVLSLAVFLAFFMEYLAFVKSEEPHRYEQFVKTLKPWKAS